MKTKSNKQNKNENFRKINFYNVKMLSLISVSLIFMLSCNSEKKRQQENAQRHLDEMMDMVRESGTPVDVKKRAAVCSVCRGDGTTKCKTCNGRGKQRSVIHGLEFYIDDCISCNGYGYFVCSNCGGAGLVEETVFIKK